MSDSVSFESAADDSQFVLTDQIIGALMNNWDKLCTTEESTNFLKETIGLCQAMLTPVSIPELNQLPNVSTISAQVSSLYLNDASTILADSYFGRFEPVYHTILTHAGKPNLRVRLLIVIGKNRT